MPLTRRGALLQILFGDDEHTASDGPYNRLMKTRKWLYLSSGSALLIANKLYDAKALKAVVKIVELPAYNAALGVLAGIIYLSIQYSFISFQLASVYGAILEERLKYRRHDELEAARNRIQSANQKIHDLTNAVESDADYILLKSELKELTGQLAAENLLSSYKSFPGAPLDNVHALQKAGLAAKAKGQIADLQSARDKCAEKLRLIEKRYDKPAERNAASAELHEASVLFKELQSRDPSKKVVYRHAEIAVDALRILPPMILALVAIVTLIQVLPSLR